MTEDKPERLYALKAAQLKLQRQECAMFGHDWNIIESGAGAPVSLHCDRCGKTWPVWREPA